jgi:hypothetical protein
MLTADDKREIRSIVADEFNKHLDKSFRKNGKAHKEVVDIVRDSFEDLFKFMWVKRTTWQRDIKG